jgi:hypothetical protein
VARQQLSEKRAFPRAKARRPEGYHPVAKQEAPSRDVFSPRTFNAVDATEKWRRTFLDRLGVEVAA